MEIPDERRIEKPLRFLPEIVSALSVSFGVRNQYGYQFQNIFLAADVCKGIVMERLFEVDGVEDLDAVLSLLQELTTLNKDAALGSSTFTLFFSGNLKLRFTMSVHKENLSGSASKPCRSWSLFLSRQSGR